MGYTAHIFFQYRNDVCITISWSSREYDRTAGYRPRLTDLAQTFAGHEAVAGAGAAAEPTDGLVAAGPLPAGLTGHRPVLLTLPVTSATSGQVTCLGRQTRRVRRPPDTASDPQAVRSHAWGDRHGGSDILLTLPVTPAAGGQVTCLGRQTRRTPPVILVE